MRVQGEVTAAVLDAQVRRQTSPAKLGRAAYLARRGAVQEMAISGEGFSCHVGNDWEIPAYVGVAYNQRGVTRVTCDLCTQQDGWCVHVAAALFALVSLRADSQVAGPGAGLEREAAASCRLAVRAALQPPKKGGKYGYSAMRKALTPLLDEIELALVGIRRPREALERLSIVTEEWLAQQRRFAVAKAAEFNDELGLLWAEALLSAELPADDAEHRRTQLSGWLRATVSSGHHGLQPALIALEEGWHAAWLVAVLDGEVVGLVLPDDNVATRALAELRIEMLHRQGRSNEADMLADAWGLLPGGEDLSDEELSADADEELLPLISMPGGRRTTPELHAADLGNTLMVWVMVRELANSGRRAQALRLAEEWLELPDSTERTWGQIELADWLLAVAPQEGRPEPAWRAGLLAQRLEPRVTRHRELRRLAGTQWPAQREECLAVLPRGHAGRIEVLLEEKLDDEVIAELASDADSECLTAAVKGLSKRRPAWAIETVGARVAALLADGGRKEGIMAVAWLKRVQPAYRAAGRMADWQAYLAQLRAQYAQRGELIARLAVFGGDAAGDEE